MRRFLIYAAAFLVIMTGLFYALDAVVTAGLRKSEQPDLVQWNEILSGEAAAELIVQGSSRAWVGISPAILSDRLGMSCYNLGVNGYPLDMQLARYKLFREYCPKPRLIVQSVDTHTFSSLDSLFGNNQFLPYLNERTVQEAVGPYDYFRWYDRDLPLVRYRGKVQLIGRGVAEALGLRHYGDYTYRGYRPNDWQWSNAFDKYAAANPNGRTQVWEARWVEALDAFLSGCAREGIVVVMVYPPEYYEAQLLVTNRDEIIGMFEGLSAKYGVAFLDYSDDPMCLDTKYFYNSQHLNRAGAEAFSAELAEDLAALVQPSQASEGRQP